MYCWTFSQVLFTLQSCEQYRTKWNSLVPRTIVLALPGPDILCSDAKHKAAFKQIVHTSDTYLIEPLFYQIAHLKWR